MSDSDEEKGPGFTQIPNDLYDAINLFDFSKREMKVIFSVMRKTLGWQRDFDYISSSQIAEMTGLHSSGVRKTIIELIQKKVIIKKRRELGVNKTVTEWSNVPKQYGNRRKESVPKQYGETYQTDTGVYQSDTEKRTKTVHTKETNKLIQKKLLKKRDEEQIEMPLEQPKKPKKTKSKKYTGGAPDFVDTENWEVFMEMRESKKAVNSERAIKLIINQLLGFIAAGHNPNAIIEKSIVEGWKSVYEPKNFSKPKNNTDWLGQTYEEFSKGSSSESVFSSGTTVEGELIQ